MQTKGQNAALWKVLNDQDYDFAEQYWFRSVLGQGGYGMVVEAISKATLESLAVKAQSSNA